ncbi:MAG: VanZ family protein [Proteobacteria bacterium]|nr:VanZ family protein [Pseudomonadota bacterium]
MLAALLILITALLLFPFPYISEARSAPALANALENLGHPLTFGLIAWIAYERFGTRFARYGLPGPVFLMLALAGFGALTELAQAYTGRDPTLEDWIGDVLGSGAVILWRASRQRLIRTLSVLCVAAAIAPLAFTLLSYPGSEPTAVTVRVHDRQHDGSFDDRFNRNFELPPSSASTLRIDLEDVHSSPAGRDMDLHHIAGVIVFARTAGPLQFQVNAIRLEH